MKTVISVTAALMLALSFGGQSNPANAADTKKPNIRPITAVPVTAQPDLFITNVVAGKCLCTPNRLDSLGALYVDGIRLDVFNQSNVSVRNVTIRATYHDLVSNRVQDVRLWYGSILRPGKTTIGLAQHAFLAKPSVGITVTLHAPDDPNPLNNSVTMKSCYTYIVQ